MKNKDFENAIISNNHKEVNEIVCRERIIAYSVVYAGTVILVDTLREAKQIARKICKETKEHVIVNYHQPWDSWREFISVYYGKNRLQWYYLHEDALDAKKY